MAKKEKEKKPSDEFDWKPEDININQDGEIEITTSESNSSTQPSMDGNTSGEAVILTEEQKRILLREEIRKANRKDYDHEDEVKGKKRKDKGVDVKVRKIGSTASTITAIIFTVISFLIVYYVMGSGDVGKIIFLGLFVVLPMEMFAIVLSVIVFISNIVFMSTGRFSFMVFLNFLVSLALIAVNIFIFYLGAEILTA